MVRRVALRACCALIPPQGLRTAQVVRTVVRMGDMRTTTHSQLTPSQRSQRARIAARARWAQQDGSTGTQAARDTFLARFERQVDPDGLLDPVERARRAESAKREHFQRMAYRRHRKGEVA